MQDRRFYFVHCCISVLARVDVVHADSRVSSYSSSSENNDEGRVEEEEEKENSGAFDWCVYINRNIAHPRKNERTKKTTKIKMMEVEKKAGEDQNVAGDVYSAEPPTKGFRPKGEKIYIENCLFSYLSRTKMNRNAGKQSLTTVREILMQCSYGMIRSMNLEILVPDRL